jgi:type IV fimbrial biogenesis protein FimT
MSGMVRHMTHPASRNDRSETTALHRVAGYSLFELVITMSIVAILMAIAVPSYRYVTSSNRSTSEINGLLSDLQFARAEAIKLGQTVTACPSSSSTGCTATAWNAGWIVFTDGPVVGTVDGNDAVIRIQPAFSSTDTLTLDKSVKAITFSREGFAMNLPSAVTFTLHDSGPNAQYTRCLSLTIVGALSTQIGTGTTNNTTAEGKAC